MGVFLFVLPFVVFFAAIKLVDVFQNWWNERFDDYGRRKD